MTKDLPIDERTNMIEQCNYCGETHDTGNGDSLAFGGVVIKTCPMIPENQPTMWKSQERQRDMTNDSAESRENDMAEQIKCVCQQWASINEDYLSSLGKLHHPNCDGKGQNIHSYATEADVQFSHSDAMTLIQRNIDKFEQQLPERWNTDGTRKPEPEWDVTVNPVGMRISYIYEDVKRMSEAMRDASRRISQTPSTLMQDFCDQ